MLATRAARNRRDAGKRGKRDVYAHHLSLYTVLFLPHWVGFSVPFQGDNCVCLWLLILLGKSMNHFLFTNGPGGIAGKQDVPYDWDQAW